MKKAYTQPASQLPGASTLVVDTSKKDLPSNTSKPSENNAQDRPNTPEHKETALPIPAGFPKGREKRQLDKPNQTSYNGPPASKDSPESKPLHKRNRTPGKEGDEYGTPWIDAGTMMNQRRTMTADHEAGYRSPGVFPTKRQHRQKGMAKLRSKQDYRRHRVQKLNVARRRYKKIRKDPRYLRYKNKLEHNPDRFHRLRASIQKVASMHLLADRYLQADFLREQEHPENLEQTYWRKRDTGTPDGPNQHSEVPDGTTTWVDFGGNTREQHVPAHQGPDYQVENNPGSARVIPEGHDFANRQASLKSASLRVAARYLEAALYSGIVDGLDPKIRDKAKGIAPRLVRVDKQNALWFFEVAGSKGERYRVKIQAKPRKNTTKDMRKADLSASCSCDFWRWQGPEYHAYTEKYLYGKVQGTAETPDVKDPQGTHRVCKHALACLDKVLTYDAPAGRE